MEAVAAASSIAGLVGLAGQTLDGIVKLHGFFKDYTSASKTVDRFLRDLNSLIQTLEDVKTLATRLENAAASTFDNKAMISSLQIQLEDCSRDVYDWVRTASEQHAKFSKGTKAVFKKFMVAVNKDSYADIFREIGSHRDGLSLKLSLIGRSLEFDHATSLQALGGKLEDIAAATTSCNQVTAETLQRLETQLAVDREARSDVPDLRSLASSVSDLVSILSSHPASPASVQSSAHCSSAGGRRSPSNIGYRRGSAASDVASNASSGGNRRHVQSSFSQGPSKSSGMAMRELERFLLLNKSGSRDNHANEEQKNREDLWNSKWEPETSRNTTVAKSEYEKHPSSYPLLGSYEKFIDMTADACPEPLLRYINQVQFSRTIKLHAKLLLSIRSSQLDISRDELQDSDDYKSVLEQLAILDHDVRLARKSCWKQGYNLDEIDMILETGCVHELLHEEPEMKESKVGDSQKSLAALQRRLEKLRDSQTWSLKQDRINLWLLQKLVASSDEAALHRSYLKGGEELEERQWARQVLKFWPLDGAAVHSGKSGASTNGAMDSLMGRHSVKVLLEMVEHASGLSDGENSEFLSETGELLRHKWDSERPSSPLRENTLLVAQDL